MAFCRLGKYPDACGYKVNLLHARMAPVGPRTNYPSTTHIARAPSESRLRGAASWRVAQGPSCELRRPPRDHLPALSPMAPHPCDASLKTVSSPPAHVRPELHGGTHD